VNCKVVKRWEGKAKGMLQVLWECGFTNAEQGGKLANNAYSIKGYKGQFGTHCLDTCPKELIACL
jgi:hypothetical protein